MTEAMEKETTSYEDRRELHWLCMERLMELLADSESDDEKHEAAAW